MKNEVLKKTLIYRGLAFTVGMMIALLMTGSIILGLILGTVSELVSLTTYYLFEISWRKYIDHRNLKKGTNVLLINNGQEDKHAWYNVIEVLGENKFIIEVV